MIGDRRRRATRCRRAVGRFPSQTMPRTAAGDERKRDYATNPNLSGSPPHDRMLGNRLLEGQPFVRCNGGGGSGDKLNSSVFL